MSKEFNIPKQVIYICEGSKCTKRGGKEIAKLFKSLIKENGLKGEIEIIKTECTDRCKSAPIFCFQPENKWFHDLTEIEAEKEFRKQFLEPKA